MRNYQLLDEKKKAKDLIEDDHVIITDQLWRVVNNFPVIGGGGRMLMLAYHTHIATAGFKFHPVTQSDERFDVLQKIE